MCQPLNHHDWAQQPLPRLRMRGAATDVASPRSATACLRAGLISQNTPMQGFWLIAAMVAASSPSRFDVFDPSNPSGSAVCWLAPRGVGRKDLDLLATKLDEAAAASMPGHVHYLVIRIHSPSREGADKGCAALVDVTVHGRRAESRFLFRAKPFSDDDWAIEETFTKGRGDLDAADLTPMFTKLWALIAPPPPPPPKPPEPPPEHFVDTDLATEQERLNAVPPPPPPRGPFVSLMLIGGLASRSVGGAPGPHLDAANVPALGAQASLHIAELFRLDDHDLDLDAAYGRSLATAQITETELAVDADRTRVGLAYRYHLGGYLPRMGVLFGWELLRFEIAEEGSVFSARYSVLRGGLTVIQPLYLDEGLRLSFALEGALRGSPTVRGGSAAPGFDVEGGVELALAFGLLAKVGARLTQQSGDIGEAGFSDRYIDVVAGIGWAL